MAGPRKSRPATPAAPTRTFVLDNGADTLKAGYVISASEPETDEEARLIPNYLVRDRRRKIYVASDISSKCRDFGEIALRRPVEKGQIVDWEAQREIWEHEFLDEQAPQRCDPAETRLLLSEQPNGLPVLQSHCDQMVFEGFGFASYYRGIAPVFSAYNDMQAIFGTPDAAAVTHHPAEAVLVIDSGYSSTTITPVLSGRPLHPAVRRLDIGGKLLTNHLVRLLSLRHFDLRNETYLVNELKEKTCFVSLDFKSDLEACWKGARGDYKQHQFYLSGSAGLARDYLLPDSHTTFHGQVRPYDPARRSRRQTDYVAAQHEDVLTLRNERFAVPEIIFSPADIGSPQPGLADCVLSSLQCLPAGLWPAFLANILLVGGCARLPSFAERLRAEIATRAPDECPVRVRRPTDPLVSTWRGMRAFARHDHAGVMAVTRQEYEEHGAGWTARRFARGLGIDGLPGPGSTS